MSEEQIIIGVRGPKGERIEVLEMPENDKLPISYAMKLQSPLFADALEKAYERYKGIRK